MKVRILYPTLTQGHGIEGEAGDVVDIDDDLAAALLPTTAVEPVESKPKTTRKAPAKK